MDDNERPYVDPLERADFLRDYYRDHSSCFTCASPDPAIIEGRFCSDCTGPGRQGFLDARVARLARETTRA